MTETEIFNKITSEHKWYIGYYSQGYASQLISRYNSGQLKQSTIDNFLQLFGYVKVKEAEYEEKPYLDPDFGKKLIPNIEELAAQVKKQLEGKPSNLKTK